MYTSWLVLYSTLGLVPEDDFQAFTTRSSLVTAGARLAWLEETRGTVNIFGCALPKCTPQRLTNYDDADGISISSLSIGERGDTLLFDRGQEADVVATSAVSPIARSTYALTWPPAGSASPPRLIAELPRVDVAVFLAVLTEMLYRQTPPRTRRVATARL